MVAHRGLGRRREEGRWQLRCLLEPSGQRDATDAAGSLVVLPARPDQIAARHRLDRQRLQAPGDDRATTNLLALSGRHYRFGVDARQVIGHHMRQSLEPERRHHVQHRTLAGNRISHDDIKRRQSVRGDQKELVGTHRIDVAHLAASNQRQTRDIGLEEWLHGRAFCVDRASGTCAPANRIPARKT